MPQILDHRNIAPEEIAGEAKVTQIPQTLRKIGYIPDLSHCRAGDLILSRSMQSDSIGRLIERTQHQVGLANVHCCWTHAAVFLYGDYIVEAELWKGVVTGSLYPSIPGSILTVRRDPLLNDDRRYQIALCAQKMLGDRYSLSKAIDAGLKAQVQSWRRNWYQINEKTVVCSQVYFDAYVEITGQLLAGCPIRDMVTPAHLSATSTLESIDIPWLTIAK